MCLLQWGQNNFFQQMVMDWIAICKNMNVDPSPTLYGYINYKWSINPNIRIKTVQKKTQENNLSDLGLGKDSQRPKHINYG